MNDLDAKFILDLQREDDVGLVLLGHLHIEHQLIELISCVLPFPDRCDWNRISYSAKVSIAHSCGLPEQLRPVLNRFGKIRNDFAHQLDASLSKNSVLGLYNSLPSLHQEVTKDTYKAMGLGNLSAPSSLPARELVVLLLLIVRQAITAAVRTLRGAAR